MSPIFNHHALSGLPSSALHHLRAALVQALASSVITHTQRAQLHAALRSVDVILCSRKAAPIPPVPAPSL